MSQRTDGESKLWLPSRRKLITGAAALAAFAAIATPAFAATFDTFDTDPIATPFVTFSNGNLTAADTSSSTSASIAQTLEGKTGALRIYVEFTCNGVSGNNDCIGLINSMGINQGVLGFDNVGSSIAYYSNGVSVFYQNSSFPSAVNKGNWTTNAVIGMAIDLTNGSVWWTADGTNWCGTSGTPNPATNTGGFSLSALTHGGARVYPCVGMRGTSAKFTMNAGGAAFRLHRAERFQRRLDKHDGRNLLRHLRHQRDQLHVYEWI